ncbi:MAG: hypothetical protein LBV12_07005 [Puniceicoccales bacterium]|jgi:hypothetical protein|nr:hypothetical protein [Puniceicoccales bacterium]
MKDSVFFIAVAASLALLWQGCQSEAPQSTAPDAPPPVTKPEENVPPRQLSNKEIPRREDRYFRGATISQLVERARGLLADENEESRIQSASLFNLGLYGTEESIQIMVDYLKENELLLPDPPPTKEELGDEKQIEKRMNVADPLTPEGKVLRTIESLIGSGLPSGRSAAEEFSSRMKSKYENTDYGTVFLEYLKKAVRRGDATIELYENIREKHNL